MNKSIRYETLRLASFIFFNYSVNQSWVFSLLKFLHQSKDCNFRSKNLSTWNSVGWRYSNVQKYEVFYVSRVIRWGLIYIVESISNANENPGRSREEYHVHLPNYSNLQAYSFYRSLRKRTQENFDQIVEALRVHFASNDFTCLNHLELHSLQQQPYRSVESYKHSFTTLHDLSGFENDTRSVACHVRGLHHHHHLQLEVFRQGSKNLNDAFLASRFAEIARESCIEQIPLVSCVLSQPEKAPEVFRNITATLEYVVNRLHITTKVNRTQSK